MSLPTITLIVNTHRQSPQLRRILAAVAAGSRPPDQVIVAEDGEDADTAAVVAESRPKLAAPLLHKTQPHLGFRRSSILNDAIAAATGEHLVFLDGDCVPHRDFIRDHAHLATPGAFTQGRRAFIRIDRVSGYLAGDTGLLRLALTGGMTGLAKGIRLPYPKIKCDRDFRGVLGCNLGIRRADLVRVNGYDEDFVGWGHEDADLAARLYANGITRRVVHGRAIVYHLDHPLAERDRAKSNRDRFEAGVAAGRLRCEHGLDAHGA
jgi:GT2 family glycosyltransferase